MATTYPLALPVLKVLIANADRTSEILSRTLHVHSLLNSQNNTCTFEMKCPESWRGAATVKPTVGQTVEVQIQTRTRPEGQADTAPFVTVFGGTISRVQEVRMAHKTVKWGVECRDYTSLLKQNLVNTRYNDWRIDAIVRDIVAKYAPQVILDANVQECDTEIDTITWSWVYPAECLDKLAQAVGYQWYVDSKKVLHFYLPGSSTKPSPNSITDTSANFNDLLVEPQLDQVRNRVYVRGGNDYTTLREEFTADGTEAWRTIQLANYPVTMQISNSSTELVPSLTINGAQQVVGLQGYADESVYQGGWLLDATNGTLYATDTHVTPADLDSIVVTYSANIPINTMREDTASQWAVAVLESGTYANQVLQDRPVHWWRLGDTGATAFNSASAPASDQTRYQGTYFGSVEKPSPGAFGQDPQKSTVYQGGWMQTLSGVVWPLPQYTVEAWVRTPPVATAIILHNRSAAGYGQAIRLGANATYELQQIDDLSYETNVNSSTRPTSAGWDYVVATRDAAGRAYLYVNNSLTVSGNTNTPGTLMVGPTAVIGSGGITQLQEVALYNYALSGSRIAAHYNAGRFAGVREYVVVDNNLTSMDDARTTADLQLTQWGSVITHVSFTSYVPGWKVGDAVSVNITTTGTTGLDGLGRTWAGTPIIQELDLDWVGAQRVLYRVQAMESRLNWIDYQRLLSTRHDRIPGQRAILDHIKIPEHAQLILTDSIAAPVSSTAPYAIQPDWGVRTVPISKINAAQVNTGRW